MDCDVSIRKY